MTFCQGPRALGVRRIKEWHKSWVYYLEVPHNFALMHQVGIPTFYFANLYLPWFSWLFAEALGPRGCVRLKSGIKAGCTIWRYPTTLLLSISFEFQSWGGGEGQKWPKKRINEKIWTTKITKRLLNLKYFILLNYKNAICDTRLLYDFCGN